MASSMARQCYVPGCANPVPNLRGGALASAGSRNLSSARRSVSLEPPAKFFVNSGLVSTPSDIYNLLRPLLKQTVSYRYLRRDKQVSSGTGWVERIVVDRPEISTFFTPLSICLNIDSFEHLEFETRPDQLIVYTLVQGDEKVLVEFAPLGHSLPDEPEQQQLAFPASDYVQMELSALEADGREQPGEGSQPEE
jgi:hypothetical protein